MGWYCPGGVRQEGNVLKCLSQRKSPMAAVSNPMETIGDFEDGRFRGKPVTQENHVSSNLIMSIAHDF